MPDNENHITIKSRRAGIPPPGVLSPYSFYTFGSKICYIKVFDLTVFSGYASVIDPILQGKNVHDHSIITPSNQVRFQKILLEEHAKSNLWSYGPLDTMFLKVLSDIQNHHPTLITKEDFNKYIALIKLQQ